MILLKERTALLCQLGEYMLSDNANWDAAKQRAINANAWFTRGSVNIAIKNIASAFLQKQKLEQWISGYNPTQSPKTIGVVMAGNIPLVGFHDFLCVFMSGHNLKMKLSSKDEVLMKHLVDMLVTWEPALLQHIIISEMLKNCDAYIATGSNNTARYFEAYFGKYPNIIRKNRTSVAVLDGSESKEELQLLAKDVFTYFGLGCRNVTQVCVPQGYDFSKLMEIFSLHGDMANHNKYKNNYDYYLAIYMLNRVPYLDNESILLTESEIPFSAVGVMHYRYYTDKNALFTELEQNEHIQCIVGKGAIPFGDSQTPGLEDYADGVNTMTFLAAL